MNLSADVDLHCSALTRELGEPAPGSAGSMQHVVLVELPLPWPKSIEDHPLLSDADLTGIKVFGIAGSASATGTHTIISYQAVGGSSTSFNQSERTVPTTELAHSVSTAAAWLHAPSKITDLLICTHGSRDRCCGQYGTLLHIEMLALAPENTRIWRASHLGGHRFAPTVMSFPDGLSWAYVDAEAVNGILTRTALPAVVAPLLRGAVALPSKAAQAADAAVFAQAGWGWLDGPRSFIEIETVDDGQHVTASSPNSTFKVTVEQVAPMPVPACGLPIEMAKKVAHPVSARLSPSA